MDRSTSDLESDVTDGYISHANHVKQNVADALVGPSSEFQRALF
jgi:hypothetical protein